MADPLPNRNTTNRRRHLFVGAVLLLVVVGIAFYLKTSAFLADPIRLHFAGLSAEAEERILLLVSEQANPSQYQPRDRPRIGSTGYFSIQSAWNHGMLIRMRQSDLANLTQLTITIGKRTYTVSGAEVQDWPRDEGGGWEQKRIELPSGQQQAIVQPGDVMLKVPARFGNESSLPWVSRSMQNWPGDGAYLRAVVQNSLVPCVLVLLLSWWLGHRTAPWCPEILGLQPAIANLAIEPASGALPSGRPSHGWNWLGLLVLVSALAFLEIRQPFYFTQDDNATESLPLIVLGCRSYWASEFPHYNPYLFLGSPLASLGLYGLTYPPTVASYALARHVLQNEYATVDVYAITHLLCGFFVIRLLGRRLGMGPVPANLTALSCDLSGAALIMGRSWFNFVPILVWLPLLFLGLLRLRETEKVGWKWIVGMALAMAAPFHVGFSQVAVYVSGFFCLAVAFLLFTGALQKRSLLPVFSALLIGAAIALPLVYQQWILAQGAERTLPAGEGIGPGLPALLLPYPLVQTQLPTGWGNEHLETMGQFYFFGGVLAFLFFVQATGLLIFRPGRKEWAGQEWIFCAVIALWLSLGDVGVLWKVVSSLPGLGFIFRYPMRMMPFVVFFVSISGGLLLERIVVRTLRVRNSAHGVCGLQSWDAAHGVCGLQSWNTAHGVCGLQCLLLLWHVFLCQPAFYVYHAPIYPELPERLEMLLRPNGQATARMMPWTPPASADSNFFALLPQDLPAVYRLPIRGGYNPLLGGKQPSAGDFWTSTRVYGVAWHFLPERPGSVSSAYSQNWRFEVAAPIDPRVLAHVPEGLTLEQLYDENGVVVKKLSPVDPLAFTVDDPSNVSGTSQPALPIVMHGGGVDVNIQGVTEKFVIVNFRHWPEMRLFPWIDTPAHKPVAAFIDGEPVMCAKDHFERIIVPMPKEGATLSIRYRAPWAMGIWLGMATAAAGLAVAIINAAVHRKLQAPSAAASSANGANRCS